MSRFDLSQISSGLTPDESGCWVSPAPGAVSYPDDGNASCFEIEEKSFWFRHRNACITDVIRRFPPPGVLFDVGGGNGAVAAAIERAGFETVLIEPGRQGALNARSRGLQRVVCSTLGDAGFREHALPAVGLFDVLEHIDDDTRFLSQISELLIPEGRLYITVPAYSWLWSAEDARAGHFRRYRLSTLRRILSTCGFTVEFATYIFWFLPLPILLFRAIPYRLGFSERFDPQAAAQDHRLPSGMAGRFLNWAMALEEVRLARDARMPFGGSCLVVGKSAL